ncbi:GAF domain-containing sensor histidine kinase [Pseudomonas sp. RIT-PI-S]|uniref:GAF domain-containing sensor histidine kinase n=1 Tax=Pseudomonas sp. RIT-PI-S TaxID=3035295 RepID=UPI0021DA2C38|nr:GAF domain-containing sensor histidine kinase [Pseudomonas sp. RIT-PI-S]
MANNFSSDVALIGRIEAVPGMLRVLCDTTGLRFAAVARVSDSHWTACAVHDRLGFGLEPGGQLELSSTLCDEIRGSHRTIVIDHASTDPLYCNHHTPRQYSFESYISVPLFYPDGRLFGTVCAFDPLPTQLRNSTATTMVESFARLLTTLMESQDHQQRTEQALLHEREVAELREQFIAVLGHDLRNPLFAIGAGAELLLRRSPDERTKGIVEHILASGRRASRLVEDVLDFARGRLGGGITVNLEPCPDLPQALRHVVAEIQRVHPQRTLQLFLGDLDGACCDRERVSQLVSNLVSNAIVHGARDGVVTITAERTATGLLISVHNLGPVIEDAVLVKLFQPFSRGHGERAGSGLGLGLYIAQQIAEAHGGHLQVTSSVEAGTLFSFHLPQPPRAPALG